MPSTPSDFAWGNALPPLAHGRVALRHLRPADAEAMLAVFGDDEVMRYWSSPPLPSVDAARALLCEIDEAFRARRLFQWGVTLAGAHEVVGTTTLFQLDVAHRRAEVGFALRRDLWGSGLARDALCAVLGFAFDGLGLHRIEADADPQNERSLRLLERVGFRREGLARERWHHLGQVQDGVLLGLLRREYRGA